MARANLHVSQEVIDAFLSAQESRSVRILKVRIVGEEMTLESTLDRQADVQEDFNNLLHNSLSATEACFAIFCLTDESQGSLSWLLVSWVPDGCRVRDKMLYSSSREDIKFSLGLGYFKSEYSPSEFAEINWESFQNSLKKDFDPNVLTETERLVLEEKALTQKESGDIKSTALGVIPFDVSPEVSAQFTQFQEGNCNWIDLTVVNEVVQLLSAKNVGAGDELKPLINSEVARYVGLSLNILCSSSGTFLQFYSGEIC